MSPEPYHVSRHTYHVSLSHSRTLALSHSRTHALTHSRSLTQSKPEPYLYPEFGREKRVLTITCGTDHMVAITDETSRNLYTWGQNDFGQCGTGGERTIATPTRVTQLMHRMVNAAAGQQFTLALTDRGRLFGCGKNADGQLGLGQIKGNGWQLEEEPSVTSFKELKVRKRRGKVCVCVCVFNSLTLVHSFTSAVRVTIWHTYIVSTVSWHTYGGRGNLTE